MFNDLIQAYFNGDFAEDNGDVATELDKLLNKVYNREFIDGKKEGFKLGKEN